MIFLSKKLVHLRVFVKVLDGETHLTFTFISSHNLILLICFIHICFSLFFINKIYYMYKLVSFVLHDFFSSFFRTV